MSGVVWWFLGRGLLGDRGGCKDPNHPQRNERNREWEGRQEANAGRVVALKECSGV